MMMWMFMSCLRTAFISEMPSMPGIRISVIRICGRVAAIIVIASAPLCASPDISSPRLSHSMVSRRPLQMSGSSSTMNTLYMAFHILL